jgi:hypothetical protein
MSTKLITKQHLYLNQLKLKEETGMRTILSLLVALHFHVVTMVHSSSHDPLWISLSDKLSPSLIDQDDPLFRQQSVFINSFSMGYHSYSTQFSIRTIQPTTSLFSTPPSTPPSTRPVSKKPTLVPSTLKTKPPSSLLVPSIAPSIRPTVVPVVQNVTNSTAGIQGTASTSSPKSNSKLIPYIVSATVVSVVGFLSVTALIVSRRRRHNEALYFSDEYEDDSLETLSNL